MAVQTTVSADPSKPFAGKLHGTGAFTLLSRINGESSAIRFGVGVVEGTTEGTILLPSLTGFSLLGIVAHEHRADNRTMSNDDGLAAGGQANVLTNGLIWVQPEQDAITPASPVYVRHTAGGGNLKGSFRKDADTNKADAVTQCRYLTSGSSTVPVLLQINRP